MKKINKASLFLILTFGISYIAAGVYKLAGGELRTTSGTVLSVAYMFIPMISVLIVEKLVHRARIKEPLLMSFRFNTWFLAAWLITPLMSFITIGVSVLFPDVVYSPEMTGIIERFLKDLNSTETGQARTALQQMPVHPIWIGLVQGLIAGITINAVAAFGEELGWRGFLVRQFSGMNFVKASLIIGFIWGLWHAPLVLMGHNYPEHPVAGVFMMIAWCILLSPLFLYITIQSRSVIAASIMHGTLNGTAGLAILVIDGGNDLTVGLTGLAGFITVILILVLIFVYDTVITRKFITSKRIEFSLEQSR